jgi:hypothetical protein
MTLCAALAASDGTAHRAMKERDESPVDKNRALLTGFFVSFALTLIPLPVFPSLPGMAALLDVVVHDLSFALAVVFAVPLLWRALRRLFNA